MKIFKLFIYALITSLISALLICILSYEYIASYSKPYIFHNQNNIPKGKVGLLLGTSKYLRRGTLNYYYKYRIDQTASLYKNGIIKCIVVSGDNSDHRYNEPIQMRNDLIKKGIPEDAITMDYAGFRTLDSVVRMKKVFGAGDNVLIISQNFHDERAIFLARKNDLNATAIACKDVPERYGIKTQIREYFARVKAILDIYILKTKPKFLGKREKINGC
ncbi:SanA/YdcF family protein [Aureibacter tunicatorum]|uniref:SanA protein n=1 Tax=Aureibacter tunicatorum TaxID=866807 RepID=A0AAE3XQV3_9BACT|nr:ElyC/SanA/YdcF family protein [Aureibacter tunicatorum]MDR6240368.1 SanA protein [Aureibacter tunicatorum]BDD05751.1 hypothetical protein AUTU_32340 [Aureibacter tunicatorum]